jgi:hypothetical protein
VTGLPDRLVAVQGRLTAIYRLDLELCAADFLLPAGRVQELLPAAGPRTGLLAVERDGALHLGLYFDPQDEADPGALVEETSHLLCLAWHALRGQPVSRLQLELQGEVDRYAVARVSGGDRLGHFSDFDWGGWMDAETQQRYRTAHRVAQRYCRRLEARFPHRADTPAWLSELRRFYRSAPDARLRAA